MHSRMAIIACVMVAVLAAAAGAAELDRTRYLPLSEVRPGMIGVGKTTLDGSEIVEFEVIVLVVLKNVFPQRDVIMVRCRGAGLEETGIVAGMSGSPVYVDGRLMGALAFAFEWGKAPIAGVQPIEQMLRVTERAPPAGPPAAEAGIGAPLEAPAAGGDLSANDGPTALTRASAGGTFDLEPIRMPVLVAGASPRMLARLREDLAPFDLVPMQGGGSAGAAAEGAPLAPGAPVAVGLLRGDLDVSVLGTVTEVVGDRVYAFGHPMFGSGEVDYPLLTSVSQVVVPSLALSFRLGTPAEEVGRLLSDEETGVFGRLGAGRAAMVPIRVTVRGPGEGEAREFRYEMVQHRMFSPILAALAAAGSLAHRAELPTDHTIAYRLAVKPAGHEVIVRENFAASPDGDFYVLSQVRNLVTVLMNNPFERLAVESVEVRAEIEARSRRAEIQEARLLASAVRPGETVPAEVRIQPWGAEAVWVPLKVGVPADYPDGTYRLTVCGADEALRAEAREVPARFRPRDLEGLLRMLGRDLARNQLVVRLEAPGSGLSVGAEELPNLPASMRGVLADAARERVSPMSASRVTMQPVEWVLGGEASLDLVVDRRAPKP